jgi:Profilin
MRSPAAATRRLPTALDKASSSTIPFVETHLRTSCQLSIEVQSGPFGNDHETPRNPVQQTAPRSCPGNLYALTPHPHSTREKLTHGWLTLFRSTRSPISFCLSASLSLSLSLFAQYIDQQLLPSGCCYAAILSHSGTPFASSPSYEVLPEEAFRLSTALDSPSLDALVRTGFTVGGARYAYTRGEAVEAAEDAGVAPYVQGRCVEKGKGEQSVIVMRLRTCLVVGVYHPTYSSRSFEQVNLDVGRLADYIMESGY